MSSYCCSKFEKALEWGTDFAEEGPAISHMDSEYWIGTDLGAIHFCPWCGYELEE
jgi:hypothetical protein